MRYTLVTVLLSTSIASAQSFFGVDIGALLRNINLASPDDKRFLDFHPPGAGDVRSPCPALNALANHGFIHRDGKNMTLPHLLVGLSEGLNIGPDFVTVIGAAGILSSPNPLGGAFNLDDLNQHHFPIEHDASMSRQDAHLGSPGPFYKPNWDQYMSFFEGKETVDLATASRAKHARYLDSVQKNPEFQYGPEEFILTYGENALYIQAMSDPIIGLPKVEYVRTFFEQEKLPYDQGWRRSPLPITLPSLAVMLLEMAALSPEPIPEGFKILTNSYKDVLVNLVGGSQVLANVTEGISSLFGF